MVIAVTRPEFTRQACELMKGTVALSYWERVPPSMANVKQNSRCSSDRRPTDRELASFSGLARPSPLTLRPGPLINRNF